MANWFKTLLWYSKRPNLYPQLLKELSRSSKSSPQNNSQIEALAWCELYSVDTNTAVQKITGSPIPERIVDKFSEVFTVAQQQVAACPVEMGGPGDLDLIYWLAEYSSAMNVIETGVAYGWSSLSFLLSLQSRPGSKLMSTDMPYKNRNNDQYVGCVVPPELRSNWRILRYADRQALPRALKELGTLDICHYDSDKTYEGRMWAYPILWKALRKNGILMSDDIGDNVAFRDFCSSIGVEPVVVKSGRRYIGILTKSSNEG